MRGGETQEPKCPPQKHLAWAPTGPQTPTGEKGHPGKNLPMLLAIACKKTVFTSCKTGNGYEHGPLPSPNQPSFYREVAPHDPFQQTEGKLGTIGSPPAPGSSQGGRGVQQAAPGTAGREGGPLREGSSDGCGTDTYGRRHTQENVCTYGCSLAGRGNHRPQRGKQE